MPVWRAAYDGDELVSIDCETTGLDVKKDQILSVGAIKVKGDAILTSQRLDFLVRPKEPMSERTILIHHIRPIDLERAIPVDEAIRRVLDFVGPRPLIGYFLEFDVGDAQQVCPAVDRRAAAQSRDRGVAPLLRLACRARCRPGGNIDLRFETIRQRLDLPRRAAHDAFNDALLTAMMYLRLQGRLETRSAGLTLVGAARST